MAFAVGATLLPRTAAPVPIAGSPAVGSSTIAGAAGAPPAHRPSVLTSLVAGQWQLAKVRAALPRPQQVDPERLEFQDFVQYVFDGGAFRLCVDPGGASVFGLLVDASRSRYRDFARLAASRGYAVYHEGRYVLVVPIRNVPRALMQRLGARRWREKELTHLLGPPSYHWHVHGVGDWGLTFVPLGLSFVGGWRNDRSTVAYQLVTEEPGCGEAGLPPLASSRDVDRRALTRRVRDAFARELLGQREQIDQALATGVPSPDGRFVVGRVNLGGLANTEQLVIRERDRPERRYPAPHFTDEKTYRWRDARTVLFEVQVVDQEFYSLDARTGALTLLAKVPYDSANPVVDFGTSSARTLWYRTADGARHEAVVPDQ